MAMRSASRLGVCVLLLPLAVARVYAAQDGTHAPHPAHTRSVLVLTADDLTRPWMGLMADGVRDVLQEQLPDVALYLEPLDTTRFEGDDFMEELRSWLSRKYRDRRPDLILAISQEAVDFLARKNGRPWPDVPVIYMELEALTIDISKSLPMASGVLLQESLTGALSTITTLLPRTRKIGVIYGAADVEVGRFGTMAQRIHSMRPDLEGVDLGRMSMDDLTARIRSLPDDVALFNFSVQVDATGRTFSASLPCRLLVAAANRPLFTQGGQDFGCGIVGGLMRDWTLAGRALGERAVGQLRGEPQHDTRVPVMSWCRLQFDARQLARWGIPESRLPAGSEVFFRSPSLWRDYRGTVLGAILLTVLQSALIAGLLFEHHRRRAAEVAAQRHLVTMAHLDRRGAMGELATSLAHELNQPLNAILQNAGVAEMLLERGLEPETLAETREILTDIRNDDLRASAVIQRMRNLLQKRELDLGPVDAGGLVRDTMALVRAEAAARDVRIDADVEESLPPMRGDRVHLQQVLLNLMLNAMDAVAPLTSARHEITLHVRRAHNDIRIAVEDRGVGLSAQSPSDIFEPFFTSKANGMGMGLAIARSIVEAHAGRIGAESNPRGGAIVWFSVPIHTEPGP